MNKIASIFLLLISFSLKLFSQTFPSEDFKYQISEPYKVIDARHKHYLVKGDEIIALKMEHRTLTLQKWNAKTMALANAHIAQDLPDEFVFEEIVEFSGSYYFFYSLWDDQSHAHKLFYREIDFEKVEMSADILLAEAPERIATQPLGYLNRFSNKFTKDKLQRFVFRISGDHSMMLIKYRIKPEITDEVKGNAKAVLIAFDGRLNQLWNKTVEMPHTENEMYTYDYAIDMEGNTYMSLLISDGKNAEGKINYHHEIASVASKSNVVDITPVTLESKQINGLLLFENTGIGVIGAGFYSSSGTNPNNSEGVFVVRKGKEGPVAGIITHDIPPHLLNYYSPDTSENKAPKKFKSLELTDLFVEKDESLLVIGEQSYFHSDDHYVPSSPFVSLRLGTVTYHYEDMLVSKINKEGGLEWMHRLPKKESGGRGRTTMSYHYLRSEKQNCHYLIFLDSYKNKDLAPNTKPYEHYEKDEGILTAYKIADKSGELSKVIILETKDFATRGLHQFTMERLFTVNPEAFVMEAYNKENRDILIKVSINK